MSVCMYVICHTLNNIVDVGYIAVQHIYEVPGHLCHDGII